MHPLAPRALIGCAREKKNTRNPKGCGTREEKRGKAKSRFLLGSWAAGWLAGWLAVSEATETKQPKHCTRLESWSFQQRITARTGSQAATELTQTLGKEPPRSRGPTEGRGFESARPMIIYRSGKGNR